MKPVGIELPDMSFNLKRLSNGLTFIYKNLPGTGIVDVRLVMRAGAIYDKALGVPAGTAHFLEHIVHEQTEKYPNRESLLNLVAAKGGQRNATTFTHEKMSFYATVLKEEAESAADYVSELTSHAILSEKATEKHRSIITEEYLNKLKQPSLKGWLAFRQAIFSGTGAEYMALGDVESISKVKLEDMVAFYEQRFAADNSILTIYGDINEASADDLARRYFEGMKRGTATDGNASAGSLGLFCPHAFPEAEARIGDTAKKFAFVEIPDVQAVVHFGGMTFGRGGKGVGDEPFSDAGYFPLAVLFQMLAGDATSILSRILRDEKHLLYHIGCAQFNADRFGTFAFVLNIAPENIQQSLDIIRAEVTKIAEGNFTDDMVTLAKTRIRAREIFANQAVQDLADSDASTLLLYTDITYPDQWIEKMEAVSVAEISSAAAYVLRHLNVLSVCANKRAEYEF